ncbi:LEM domain-containing protein 1 isoform X2 [Sceloporus undulatus]|uniref:LEM domain-containing protein 1 isoform X2 n=1 Tax=Sceloporus undulatus TaxID=8520 RepID=UPI001C4C31E8|nr:LEM domain-containing protein 1 isoform X2 [Sceloporus undulatus]
MEKLTVDVCIKTKEDSVNQAPKDEMDVQALNDTELREQLSVYGINAGPILPSTRAVYENKLLKLMKQGPTIAFGEKSRLDDSENKNGEQGQTTEVVLETNNLRVTAECASGLDNLQEILPEGKVALNRSQGLRRKVGSSPERNYKQKINDTRHIDYGYPDANSVGVSTRRRPVQVNPPSVKQVSERKSRVMSEKPEEELIPTRVKIAVLAIFIFLLFVYVTMETNVANPFSRFIMGK